MAGFFFLHHQPQNPIDPRLIARPGAEMREHVLVHADAD